MMKGQNELRINGPTLIEALQLYFDTKLFREGAAPKVVGVSELHLPTGGQVFEVQTVSEEP
jgi:hypothetical protein